MSTVTLYYLKGNERTDNIYRYKNVSVLPRFKHLWWFYKYTY